MRQEGRHPSRLGRAHVRGHRFRRPTALHGALNLEPHTELGRGAVAKGALNFWPKSGLWLKTEKSGPSVLAALFFRTTLDRVTQARRLWRSESFSRCSSFRHEKRCASMLLSEDAGNLPVLREFISESGAIQKRNYTRLCAKCQRRRRQRPTPRSRFLGVSSRSRVATVSSRSRVLESHRRCESLELSIV